MIVTLVCFVCFIIWAGFMMALVGLHNASSGRAVEHDAGGDLVFPVKEDLNDQE
jgi:hypothetical protein